MSPLVVAFLFVVAALLAARYWKHGLAAVAILVIVEGVIRKWVLPSAANVLYFGKDIVLLGVYVGFLLREGRRRTAGTVPPAVRALLLLSVAVGLVQIFNPRLPSLAVGLLGLKAYFFYAPLIWIVSSVYQTDSDLWNFLRRHLWFAIPLAALALVQFTSPHDATINTYVASGEERAAVATFGAENRARVTGTFSYISGFSAFLFFESLVGLALLSTVRWRLRDGLWFLVAMAAVAISTVATGSRAPTLLLAVVLATHLIASAGGRVRRSGVGRSLLGIGLMLALVRFVGSDVTEALAFRMRSTEENLVRRFVEPFVEPMRIFSETGFVGYGIGATHQAAANLVPKVPPYSWLDGFEIEAETSRVMLELGGLGFAAVFALRIALIVFAYRAIRRASTLFHRSIAVSAFLMMFVQLIGAVVFNVTANFYYFFCAGLVVLVHERARAAGREARAAAAEARASDRAAGARGWVDPPLPSPR